MYICTMQQPERGSAIAGVDVIVAGVIVDLRMLHIAGKQSIKQDLLPAVNVVHSWVPLSHQFVSLQCLFLHFVLFI